MSLTSGIKINNRDLVLYLDIFNTPSWNIGRRVVVDLSTKKNNFIVEGSTLPLVSNTEGYIQFLGSTAHYLKTDDTGTDDFSFDTRDFTIEAWIYPQNFTNYTHIFSINNQNTFALKADVTSGRVYFNSSTFTTYNDVTNWNLNLNQWNQVVFKRQNSIAYCYLNGNLVGSKSGFTNNFPEQPEAFIRYANVAEYSQTRFRQVLVYKRALADVEVKQHYALFTPRSYIPAVSNGPLSATTTVASRSATIGSSVISFVPINGQGGIGSLTYRITPSLPVGIFFNITDGEISGVPVGTSNQSYTVTVSDAAGNSQSANFTFIVTAPPLTAIRPSGTYSFLVNSNVDIEPIIANGGFSTLTYSINPALPTGLTLNTGTGTISGIPSTLSNLTNYTITVQDSVVPTPQSASVTFQISVFPAALSIVVNQPTISTNTGTALDVTPVSASGGFGTLTYGISPGLPAGLSFNTSNGKITGSATSALSQTQFTVTVTDQAPQSVNANFNLTISAGLYAFSTFTFTNAGITGINGPTLSQCISSYNTTTNPWLTNSAYFNVVTQGVQEWTVPSTGTYRITSGGASGGTQVWGENQGTGNFNSFAAQVQGDLSLTINQKIRIIVGQRGENIGTYLSGILTNVSERDNAAPGGGGGSFVFLNASDAEPLIAAGGGAGGVRVVATNVNASLTTSGNNSQSTTNGGTNGNGGLPNNGGSSYWAGSGAGWKNDGTGGNTVTPYSYIGGSQGAQGGRRPANGAIGGVRWNDGTDSGGNGGFGGGGGGGSDNMGSGGGGGYSGGGGARYDPTENSGGGGGGSYITPTATNTSITLRGTVAHGFVTIQKL